MIARALLASVCAFGLLLGRPGVARAHPLAPAALLLDEQADGTLAVTWRTSRPRPRGETLEPTFPRRCTVAAGSERVETSVDADVRRFTLRCGRGDLAGLANEPIGVPGLTGTVANVFVELRFRDGRRAHALLDPGHTAFRVDPAQATRAPSGRGFVALGVEHLLTGVDHVLFVLGLLFAVRRLRMLVPLVTAFTVGHSVSLALSALGWVAVPTALVELAIALSLLWLALRVLDRRAEGADPVSPGSEAASRALDRQAALVCVGFGVVHGLGFASAFADLGASPVTLPRALFGFNVGVELGQLAVVLPAAALLAWMRQGDALGRRDARAAGWAAYVVGTASAYLVIERVPDAVRWMSRWGS